MRPALLVLLLVVARPMLADNPALKPKPDAGPVAWTAGPYGYDGAGNITAIGGESFVYDKVGRLRTGTVRGPDLSTMQTQTFDYDVYGNLISTSKLGQTVPLDVDVLTNRLQGVSYDASGNLTTSGAQHYAYDALGMLNTVRRFEALRESAGRVIGGELRVKDRDDESCRLTVHSAKRAMARLVGTPAGRLLMEDSVATYGAGQQFYNHYHENGVFAFAAAGSRVLRAQFLVYRPVIADVQNCIVGSIITEIDTDRGVFLARSAPGTCRVGSDVHFTAAGPDPVRVSHADIRLP